MAHPTADAKGRRARRGRSRHPPVRRSNGSTGRAALGGHLRLVLLCAAGSRARDRKGAPGGPSCGMGTAIGGQLERPRAPLFVHRCPHTKRLAPRSPRGRTRPETRLVFSLLITFLDPKED